VGDAADSPRRRWFIAVDSDIGGAISCRFSVVTAGGIGGPSARHRHALASLDLLGIRIFGNGRNTRAAVAFLQIWQERSPCSGGTSTGRKGASGFELVDYSAKRTRVFAEVSVSRNKLRPTAVPVHYLAGEER
jgi:hypothetical protein